MCLWKWMLAGLAVAAVAAAVHPGMRQRGGLVGRKLLGQSDLSWVETTVRLAPWRMQDRVRSVLGFTAPQWIQPLDYSMELGDLPRRRYDIFLGPTPNIRRLDCHYSVLQSGKTPHPPHRHDEEEIVIPIHGEVDVIRVAAGDAERRQTDRAGPGQVIYHASNQAHTIRAAGSGPSAYLVFRWVGSSREIGAVLASSIFDIRERLAADLALAEDRDKTDIFASQTSSLGRLACHLTTVKPGAGSNPHRNRHDVALVVLRGSIETLNQTVNAPSVAFYPAHTLHSARNAGASPAQYLAIEFHDRPRD